MEAAHPSLILPNLTPGLEDQRRGVVVVCLSRPPRPVLNAKPQHPWALNSHLPHCNTSARLKPLSLTARGPNFPVLGQNQHLPQVSLVKKIMLPVVMKCQ